MKSQLDVIKQSVNGNYYMYERYCITQQNHLQLNTVNNLK